MYFPQTCYFFYNWGGGDSAPPPPLIQLMNYERVYTSTWGNPSGSKFLSALPIFLLVPCDLTSRYGDIETIIRVGVFIFIVVSAAEVIHVTTFISGRSPTKSHHRTKAFITKYHLSFVSYKRETIISQVQWNSVAMKNLHPICLKHMVCASYKQDTDFSMPLKFVVESSPYKTRAMYLVEHM